MTARIFVDKTKRFSLKRALHKDDFENDLETFFPPVNEGAEEVASALSESLLTIVNQLAKRKNKSTNKDYLYLKVFWLAGYETWSDAELPIQDIKNQLTWYQI